MKLQRSLKMNCDAYTMPIMQSANATQKKSYFYLNNVITKDYKNIFLSCYQIV